jgi:hypothetical protein
MARLAFLTSAAAKQRRPLVVQTTEVADLTTGVQTQKGSKGDQAMYDESKHVPAFGYTSMGTAGGANSNAVFWRSDIGDFQVVPPGKTLTITDVLLNPELNVTAPHPVYLSNVWPDGTSVDFFQLLAQPVATQQAHFLTGHLIESGHTVLASTPIPPPSGQYGQYMNVWLNGYLPKSWTLWLWRSKLTRKPMIRPNVPPVA